MSYGAVGSPFRPTLKNCLQQESPPLLANEAANQSIGRDGVLSCLAVFTIKNTLCKAHPPAFHRVNITIILQKQEKFIVLRTESGKIHR